MQRNGGSGIHGHFGTSADDQGMEAERRDTDFNRHINNAAYLVWALDSLPDSWLKNHQLTGIHLHFRKETHAGDSMKSLLFFRDSLTSHHLMHGDELRAEAVLEWKTSEIA